jgi:hypothetical protein
MVAERQPFRYPHTRESLAQADAADPLVAAAMRDERDRALEDYLSGIADGQGGVEGYALSFYREWLTTDANASLELLHTGDLATGEWEVYSTATVEDADTTGPPTLTSLVGEDAPPPPYAQDEEATVEITGAVISVDSPVITVTGPGTVTGSNEITGLSTGGTDLGTRRVVEILAVRVG